jgi:hypothetical protein
MLAFYGNYMHRTCLAPKKMLESAMLHEVVPQAPLQRPPSLAESLLRLAYMR